MSLVTITVVFFIVIGSINLYIGLRKLQISQRSGGSSHWYEQYQIHTGLTCFSLGLFFLLVGFWDARPKGDFAGRLELVIPAGVVLLGGTVSCILMIYYFLLTQRRG